MCSYVSFGIPRPPNNESRPIPSTDSIHPFPHLQRCHNEMLRHVPARLLRADLDPLTDGLLRGVDVKDGDASGRAIATNGVMGPL